MDMRWRELVERYAKTGTFATKALTDDVGDALLWLNNRFPEGLLLVLLDLVDDPRLLNSEDSHWLLGLFQAEWESLDESHKAKLASSIESSFEHAKDWMFRFTASEILGENLSNRQALDILVRLRGCENVRARSLVPHGFEHIVSDSGDDELAREARRHLTEMQDDPAEKVREEAVLSVERLARQVQRRGEK